MKINFDNDNMNLNSVSKNDTRIQNRAIEKNDFNQSEGSFLVSFGENRNNYAAYSDKKTGSDDQSVLGADEVTLKRNYMSVMSLSMSGADYAEFARTGEVPEDMDVADSVTIMDEIKTALIKGGTSVMGYTDDISKEKLVEIAGSVAMANELADSLALQDVPVTEDHLRMAVDAVKTAQSVLPLSDAATRYIIENNQAPTINNIYHASHVGAAIPTLEEGDNPSASGVGTYFNQNGYLTRVASSNEIKEEDLLPQIDETIRRSGLENTENVREEALWLVNNSIGLTPDTLIRLDDLSELREGITQEKIITSVSVAMSAGIDPKNANLTYDESVFIKAEEIIEEVKSIDDSVVNQAVSEDKTLNIRNLRALSLTDSVNYVSDYDSEELIRARRTLEEVRLSMTVEANRLLLRSNFRIDTAPIEELVDALKAAEKQFAKQLFPDSDENSINEKVEIYTQAKNEIPRIYSAPAAILGQLSEDGSFEFESGKPFTLHDVYESGATRRNEYVKAGETYEALMTAPRADLGDRIGKAFRNVDDILKDLNFETDENNRRAVRILGYNSMEITPERIEQVREADSELRSTLEKMTPSRVLNMIRENVNPLNMTISELGSYMDSKEKDFGQQTADFAQFLMRLERRNEITKEERDSYIGIYRMITGIGKKDDAAVGSIIDSGREMSFSSLLSAMRTAAKPAMDIKINDDFGGMVSERKNAAIDEQINSAYISGRFAESAQVNSIVIENLISSGQAVSPMNVEALDSLKTKRGDWLKPITEQFLDGIRFKDDFEEAVDEVVGEYVDAITLYDEYNKMLDTARESISNMLENEDGIIDLRAMRSSLAQISILKHFASDDMFDIPTVIDGEATTIRLTLRHSKGAGKLNVTLDCNSIGRIAGEFTLAGTRNGYIAYELPAAKDRLSGIMSELTDVLSFVPELVKADHINPEKYTDNIFGQKNNENSIKKDGDLADINNIEMINTAKEFIRVLRKI